MTKQRLELEKKVLELHLPKSAFVFRDIETSTPYVMFAANTNSGNIYTIRVELKNFPEQIPEAYVTKLLYTKDGVPMDKPSSSMHTLESKNNWTRLCHYGYQSWHPNVALYKVYIKCRLWLEMYELHLVSGNNMDYYLNHQQ